MTEEDPEPWVEYAAATVEIDFGSRRIRLQPGQVGITEGIFPPAGLPTIYVITAFNPTSDRRLTSTQNRTRQDALESELTSKGFQWWPARGGDAGWVHVEDSAAIVGLHRSEAIAIGQAWGQDAIFAWTPTDWTLLPCSDRAPTVMGWRI